ncbi:Membrane magnesium transporter-like protein, partial [Frankliniella fusca]
WQGYSLWIFEILGEKFFFPENYRIVQGDSYLTLDQAPREGSPADTVSRAEMHFFLNFFRCYFPYFSQSKTVRALLTYGILF